MESYSYRLDPQKLRHMKRLKRETRPRIKGLYRSSESLTLEELTQEVFPYDIIKMIMDGALIGPQEKQVYTYLRSEARKALWEDPNSPYRTEEFRQKLSESQKERWQDPEQKQKKSEVIRAIWEDPNSPYRTEELRQKRSEKMKAFWDDPELRQKQSKTQKERWQDPEYRQKLLEAQRVRWADPNSPYRTEEYRQKRSETMRDVWEVKKYVGLIILEDIKQHTPNPHPIEYLLQIIAHDHKPTRFLQMQKAIIKELQD